MKVRLEDIHERVRRAGEQGRGEPQTGPPALSQSVSWPVTCHVGPGLEGAIACESQVGFVHGALGRLVYRGYDVYDLALHSTFEETAFLLLFGALPSAGELEEFKALLVAERRVPQTLRLLMGFPVERMNVMAALRLGTNLMRQEFGRADREQACPESSEVLCADEDSMAMECAPVGAAHATYELPPAGPGAVDAGWEACCHLIAGVGTLAAAIARIRAGRMPLEPDPGLSHAGNFLAMLTGRRPSPVEERLLDIALILHADHGMNASTFACMVVASTLSDFYLSVGAGIAALNGPLHGGANERVVRMLRAIGGPENVRAWYRAARDRGEKVMGFGHRVYRTYDPRARILGPLAEAVASQDPAWRSLLQTARALEEVVTEDLGQEKGVYPNVDFYSGLVYAGLGIPDEMFTPTFAVSRVAGWTARVLEYQQHNRIFRPRAAYTGPLDLKYLAQEDRPASGVSPITPGSRPGC
jgi:citrate synthase